jgi:hypothetical protein
MTSTIVSHPSGDTRGHDVRGHDVLGHDVLADAAGDTALLALLRGKPAGESISSGVWWLVAETLRLTVSARRGLALPPRADDEELRNLLTEAMLLADAALCELVEGTDVHPAPIEAAPADTLFGLQRSSLTLARLLVSHRITSPQRLAAAMTVHGDVLHHHLVALQNA